VSMVEHCWETLTGGSPKFIVQLLRSKHLPANHARFRVSRNLGKLDLRDFLWNCYGVRAFNIRSSLKYSPIEDYDGRTARRKIFRRQSIKFMTIEMDEPFYWPEEPKDLSP
jgi:large subunit ribosomal protein L23